MHGPDGTDYPNHSMFEEIVPDERIVLKHLNAPHYQITATFEEADGKTLFTFRQAFEQTSFVKNNRDFLNSPMSRI